MTDHTPKFDPIPRLQQIAATIKERGAGTFDAPATAAYYINCAIKEIERLHRDYSCICKQMRRMMDERDEARRQVCVTLYTDKEMQRNHARLCGWECFKENNDD